MAISVGTACTAFQLPGTSVKQVTQSLVKKTALPNRLENQEAWLFFINRLFYGQNFKKLPRVLFVDRPKPIQPAKVYSANTASAHFALLKTS